MRTLQKLVGEFLGSCREILWEIWREFQVLLDPQSKGLKLSGQFLEHVSQEFRTSTD